MGSFDSYFVVERSSINILTLLFMYIISTCIELWFELDPVWL